MIEDFPWPWLTLLGCGALLLAAEPWKHGVAAARLWSKAWAAWLAAAFVLAYIGLFLLEGIPWRRNAAWAAWHDFGFLMRLWLLCLLPAAWAAVRWFSSGEGKRPGVLRWALSGVALGPLAAGAFSLDLILPPLLPLALLALASSLFRRPSPERLLAVAAAAQALAAMNALAEPPAWAGSAALAALACLGLCPWDPRRGLTALGLVLAAQGLWAAAGLRRGTLSFLAFALCATLGWRLSKPKETPDAHPA